MKEAAQKQKEGFDDVSAVYIVHGMQRRDECSIVSTNSRFTCGNPKHGRSVIDEMEACFKVKVASLQGLQSKGVSNGFIFCRATPVLHLNTVLSISFTMSK